MAKSKVFCQYGRFTHEGDYQECVYPSWSEEPIKEPDEAPSKREAAELQKEALLQQQSVVEPSCHIPG